MNQLLNMVDPLSYISFQPVLHNWCNKGSGVCYPVCGMVHIKESLLLIRKNGPYVISGFPSAIWVVLYYMFTPYNREKQLQYYGN